MILPLLALALLAPQDDGEYPELRPGEPAKILVSPLQDGYPTWHIAVPPGCTAMRLWTTGANDDLGLYLSSEYAGDPSMGYADVFGPNVWLDEELLVTVSDAYPLYAGDWYVSLAPGTGSLDPDDTSTIRGELHLEFPEPVRATLRPDEVLELEVTYDSALRAVLDLPEDFKPERRSTWRVELFCDSMDADLAVGPANPAQTLDYPYDTSSRTIGYEEVTFRGRQAKSLAIHAYGLPEYDPIKRAHLKLRLTEVIEGERPPSLVPPLEIPAAGPDARSRALAGTVAVFGNLGSGTGTLLSESGLVVTNAHVAVTQPSGLGASATTPALGTVYFAGFNDDPRRKASPDVQLELLDYRQDLDLALLAITGTLDGRPLPLGTRFPALERGSVEDLQLGDELLALGYPMTGGDSSLTTITLTRGILSGYAESFEGPAFKTDAAIHSGISGGAVLDRDWRLVGVPSSSITDANMAGGIGFAIPVESFPQSWLDLAALPDTAAVRDVLAGRSAVPLGPYLPLAAAAPFEQPAQVRPPAAYRERVTDRIAWALQASTVAAYLDVKDQARLRDHTEALLALEHRAFPALLNVLASLDPESAEDGDLGRTCTDLLARLLHTDDLTWGVDAEANSALVQRLVREWEAVGQDPLAWIRLAHLDRPEHRAERARFDAFLKGRPSPR